MKHRATMNFSSHLLLINYITYLLINNDRHQLYGTVVPVEV